MAEQAGTEFWRDLEPIVNPLKPDAQPEVFHQLAPLEDERYYVPLSETVGSRPLWISPRDNRWADVLWAKSAGLVNRHYHPHEVFAYTISGTWGYLEQPWTATPGSFVYQTPGKGHTLDEDGNGNDLFDVRDYLTLCREHDERVGIGAEYVDTLIR